MAIFNRNKADYRFWRGDYGDYDRFHIYLLQGNFLILRNNI